MIHLNLLPLRLRLPHGIHKNIRRTLSWNLGMTIQDRHPQHYTIALLPRLLELVHHGILTVEFGLAVEIGGRGDGLRGVGCVAGRAGEDVVG